MGLLNNNFSAIFLPEEIEDFGGDQAERFMNDVTYSDVRQNFVTRPGRLISTQKLPGCKESNSKISR